MKHSTARGRGRDAGAPGIAGIAGIYAPARAVVVLLCLLGDARAQPPLLISGYDDVLRQADNTSLVRGAAKLLSPDVGYAGMPELYRALTGEGTSPSLHVVSATSAALRPRAQAFLARAGYPAARLHFRRWLLQWSAVRFRQAQIERLLAAHPGRRAVFVFDDSPASVRVGRWLLQSRPERVAAIYLRRTANRPLPSGATPILTAFDIAVEEVAAGRLAAEDAARVAEAVLREPLPDRVIPAYAHCPRLPPACVQRHPLLADLCGRVRQRIAVACAARE